MMPASPLATGWEPDADVGDTLVRRYLFHWAAYCDTYALAAGGATTRTARYAAADLRRPSGYFNSVTLLQPFPAGDPGHVLDELEVVFGTGRGEVLLWSAWPTPDLSAHGWRLEGHPPLLVRPPARVLPPPAPPPTIDVRPVRDTAGLVQWEQVAVEGYPLPELDPVGPGDLAHSSLLDDPRLRFWVGHHAGRPVSIGTLFVEHGIASFALAVTRPEARRQGHWLAHAAHRLAAVPALWMTGVFSDHSRPLAEAIGFVPLCRLTLWARPRP